MATFNYCAFNEPHDAHEWTGSYEQIGTVWDASYFHCCGIKTDPRLEVQVLLVRAHERMLEMAQAELAELAIAHRRTEHEFYMGDNAPAEEVDDGDNGS